MSGWIFGRIVATGNGKDWSFPRSDMVLTRYATASLRCESDLDVARERLCANCEGNDGAVVVRDCCLRTIAAKVSCQLT